jgi:hypothetical protein
MRRMGPHEDPMGDLSCFEAVRELQPRVRTLVALLCKPPLKHDAALLHCKRITPRNFQTSI